MPKNWHLILTAPVLCSPAASHATGSIWGIVFENTHLSIIDKIEAAGHNIDGFTVRSDGQTLASAGTDGIFIEALYQVPEEVNGRQPGGSAIPLRHTD